MRLKNDLSALANRELLEMMQTDEGEQTVGMSAQMETWTDDQKGQERLKVLSQFVRAQAQFPGLGGSHC